MGGIHVANGAELPLAVQLNFESVRLTDEQLNQLCKNNPNTFLRIDDDVLPSAST